MFEIFSKKNDLINEQLNIEFSLIENLDNDIVEFFKEFGGKSINKGAYRAHTPISSAHWSLIVTAYFPNYLNRIMPFGYDWMGRQFAIDLHNKNRILMFDPATAEDFELDQNLVKFHDYDLVSDKESVLSIDLFHKLIKTLKIEKLEYNQCAGYKVSLFIGGTDDISNYEILDIEVYWEFQRQIYRQTKDLPPGTKINTVMFNKK